MPYHDYFFYYSKSIFPWIYAVGNVEHAFYHRHGKMPLHTPEFRAISEAGHGERLVGEQARTA